MFRVKKFIGLCIAIFIFSQLQAITSKKKDSVLELPTITTNPVVTTICAGSKLNVSYTVSNDFDPGNIFSVELSDANGNFSNPIIIGEVSSVTSGTILASLPKNLQEGFGYRVRVKGWHPAVIGSDNGENITIYELPYLIIIGNKKPCAGQTISYYTNSNLGYSYKWNVIGGEIKGNSNSTNVFVQWGYDTVSIIQLIIRNETTSCTDTLTEKISIQFAPETVIGTGKYNVCVDEIVEYIPAPGTTAASDWICQGGYILFKDASKARVRWDVQGSGWIELQKTSESGCVGKDRKIVTVHPVPIAYIAGNNRAFAGKKMLYKSLQEVGTACRWQVSGGTMQDSTSDSVYVTWGQSANGQVRLIKYYVATDCSDTAFFDVTINPSLPTGNIEGKDKVCSGSTEVYSTDTVSNSYIKWYVSGGSIVGADNGFSINVQWGAEGTAEVKFVITEFGSGIRDSVVLSIQINPIPNIIFPELGEICENDKPLSLNMAEPDGGAYIGNGVEMGYFYPIKAGVGQHEITYSFTNQFGCEATKTRTIIVNPKPAKPEITMTDSSFISSYDYGNQWFESGHPIQGATSKELIIPFGGWFTVQFTDSNGCKSDMSDGVEVPVEEYRVIDRVFIYPNPAGDYILIDNKTNLNFWKVEICDLFGNEFLRSDFTKFQIHSVQSFNTSKIPNGFYVIKLYFSNLVITKKLIINR